MNKKNWTTIGIAALIAALLYYFFTQDEGCMKCCKGSHSEVATSMDVGYGDGYGDEYGEEYGDEYGEEEAWMQDENELDGYDGYGEPVVRY